MPNFWKDEILKTGCRKIGASPIAWNRTTTTEIPGKWADCETLGYEHTGVSFDNANSTPSGASRIQRETTIIYVSRQQNLNYFLLLVTLPMFVATGVFGTLSAGTELAIPAWQVTIKLQVLMQHFNPYVTKSLRPR
jgi:hypothetical protein